MNSINQPLAQLVLGKHILDISLLDESFVNKTLSQRMESTGCLDIVEYGRFVSENEKEATLVAGLLQISYSEFFRNPLSFAVLDSLVVPELIFRKKTTKSKEIRIWSAACASGQEPYSLAMILEQHKGNNEHSSYRIFGTDKDETQINKAQMGIYSKESVGNLTQKRLLQWFIQSANSYSVSPELKKHIKFSVFDLLTNQCSSPPESIYGDFDLVMCANVLFYYKPAYRNKIINKLRDSLAADGLLITGEAERELLLSNNFKELYPQSAIFRKTN